MLIPKRTGALLLVFIFLLSFNSFSDADVGIAALSDDELLETIERQAFDYFWKEANPANGLVKDRASNFGPDYCTMASIAACGFALPAYCLGAERGYITKDQAYERVLNTLRFFWEDAQNEHGFFYHFLDINTGRRFGSSEISSIDTSLLFAGMLTAAEYFKGTEAADLAHKIYKRADWQWLLNNGNTLSHGWKPESGFLSSRWNSYSENMIIYILAIASPTHPISPDSWYAWNRPRYSYKGYSYIQCPFLFTHQYSHIFFDFKNKHDEEADYFYNSVNAVSAHKLFCNTIFKDYDNRLWGISPCDGPNGYAVWGGPPTSGNTVIDGTIAPPVMAASVMFNSEDVLESLRYIYSEYPDIFGKYGFCDSFNPRTGWKARDCIGIDIGSMLLAIENYRSGMVWKYFMRSPYIEYAEKIIGFEPTEAADDVLIFNSAKFALGVEDSWHYPGYDDTGWIDIAIPGTWEEQGFENYDGFAVYRIDFTVPKTLRSKWRDSWILLYLGSIDDADVTYFNGEEIGRTGQFPPKFDSAWSVDRIYSVPQRLINYEGTNSISIVVYDYANQGGIWRGEVLIGPSIQMDYKPFKVRPQTVLLQDLSELDWLFRPGDDMEWKEPDYEEGYEWYDIDVPYPWEEQGYQDYDGIGWYRTYLFIPRDWRGREKFLYIGGIDDADETYFNGELIGSSGHFPPDYETAWNKKRLYKVPEHIIQYGSYNIISIRVYDYVKEGGIRTGPVELRMSPEK